MSQRIRTAQLEAWAERNPLAALVLKHREQLKRLAGELPGKLQDAENRAEAAERALRDAQTHIRALKRRIAELESGA